MPRRTDISSILVIGAALLFSACGRDLNALASECGVSETELREAMEEVSEMNPYDSRELGRCSLVVDDGNDVQVLTPEIKERVRNLEE